jgi:hypothetical protein
MGMFCYHSFMNATCTLFFDESVSEHFTDIDVLQVTNHNFVLTIRYVPHRMPPKQPTK